MLGCQVLSFLDWFLGLKRSTYTRVNTVLIQLTQQQQQHPKAFQFMTWHKKAQHLTLHVWQQKPFQLSQTMLQTNALEAPTQNTLTADTGNCAFLVANATKNFAPVTKFS